MADSNATAEMLRTHPCYNEEAHLSFARMHLPVAPKCNIQCNYCNRKYDCSNESRPGVTSEVLTPEQAVEKIRAVKEKIPGLTVIGIAGPGDPLANEETFETLYLAGKEFDELTLCISTNGLALPDNVDRLYDLGVRFVTVTINATDPQVGGKIYGSVIWNGKKYHGSEGAGILLERQLDGIKKASDKGMLVKANVVMVPDVNDAHIPELVKKVKDLGAYIVNILPLIPVEGTAFGNLRAPTSEERKRLMDLCSIDAKMMRHCRQCRADAIGLLGEDRSAEFAHITGCRCKPTEENPLITVDNSNDARVAVASSGAGEVESGFGNAKRFVVYDFRDDALSYVRTEDVDTSAETAGASHREHIEDIADRLDDCRAIIVKEIGPLPTKILAARGKKVIVADVVNKAEIGRVLKK
ncbi:MAG: nitrogenase cofactor biosynthesis protein NifB [Candidatus Methanoplasma sp.]|jgi:nitrogen fixation protein NifB|nr:nitrogenase cofactor biosynthesis protein NifB [Candidatus Methanoplasma sp.]